MDGRGGGGGCCCRWWSCLLVFLVFYLFVAYSVLHPIAYVLLGAVQPCRK